MNTAERIARLRERAAEGVQLTPEAQADLDAAEAIDAKRAAANEAAAQEALAQHGCNLDGYANQEAATRKAIQRAIDAVDQIEQAYEAASASARLCRQHGHAAAAPMRIHAQQDYPTRKLVERWHATGRRPI